MVSLSGSEGLLLDLGDINKYCDRGDVSYLIITLHGKIKEEQNDVVHKITCVNTAHSGIQVKLILERLRKAKADAHSYNGPTISDINGKLLTAKDSDEMIIEILRELFADITEKK